MDTQRLTVLNGGLAAGRFYMRDRSGFTWDDRAAALGADQLRVGINYAAQQGSWKECGKTPDFANTSAPASKC